MSRQNVAELESLLKALHSQRTSTIRSANNEAMLEAQIRNARARVDSLSEALSKAQEHLHSLVNLSETWEEQVDELSLRIIKVKKDFVIAKNREKLEKLMKLKDQLNATLND